MASLGSALGKPGRLLRVLRNIPDKSAAFAAFRRSFGNPSGAGLELGEHLDATYRWLCAAQDATGDYGVSAWYDIKKGWVASYPETTGYIIPSLLSYSRAASLDDAHVRALRMADWEIEIQLPTGAVRSSLHDGSTEPAVFNTGQVIFGWSMAHRATGNPDYAEAAGRAARWLVAIQDEDGAWRRHLSRWTSSAVLTYNARTAWALAQAGVLFLEGRWVEAARRNCEWVLTQQDDSGWFEHNVFRDGEQPLLHTISYVIEGLFGVGTLIGDERFIGAARLAAEGLLARLAACGRTFGRYGPAWRPEASWRCLTGDAQFAGVLLRFRRYAGAPASYAEAAEKIIRSVCALQEMRPSHKGIYGGVPGSQPIWGEYLRYRYPNWAAKFHLDALMLFLHGVDPHHIPRG